MNALKKRIMEIRDEAEARAKAAEAKAEKYRDLIRRMNIENEGAHYGGGGAWELNTDLQKEIDEALK